MKCNVCGKENDRYQTWDYVIKKTVFGSVRNYTPGTDTVYTVGGKETARERYTTYGKGYSSKVVSRGTAYICIRCRIIWSVVFTAVLSLFCAVLVLLLPLLVEFLFRNLENTHPFHYGAIFTGALKGFLGVFAVLSFTPVMKHIILSFRIAIEHKVLPWNVLSEFWG